MRSFFGLDIRDTWRRYPGSKRALLLYFLWIVPDCGACGFQRWCAHRSWLFSEGLDEDLPDGRWIGALHILWSLEEHRGSGAIGKGEHLKEAAVEGNKVLFDEGVSRLYVVVDFHLQDRADGIEAIE